VEPTTTDVTSPDKEETQEHDALEKVQSSSNNAAETTPFPERLALTKTHEPPAFNLLGELQNLYVKIPLLQALRDVPIYARTMRDICVKKPGRKTKDPLTVHVMGDLSALMTGKTPPVKYGDPSHPTVTVQVGKTIIPHVLVDLGAAINIMTLETLQLLHLQDEVRETPTILELADRSTIKPEGVIEDLNISVESWNYPVDFTVLQPKTKLGGHPLILGRPWLATDDAFISCRSGSMTISNGYETKQLTLYPHATPLPNNDNSVWVDFEDQPTQPLLTIGQALSLKDSTEDEIINNFICEPSSVTPKIHNQLTVLMESDNPENLDSASPPQTPKTISSKSIPIEIEPGKTLNINPHLTDAETQQLTKLLQENKEAFAWDYTDMKGISPDLCTHRIYIKEHCRPICQPQRRMNPNLREILKEEVQKLLNAGFIYPISDSEWVSPLVIVPKKNGKWRVCVDYRALNKATQEDHFPLPFIDQVLDSLSGKKFFSFLDGFSGYNQIKIAPQDQEIRRCVREDEVYDILKACHDGPCGGHFADKRTTHKILRMGYYWPSIFKDAKKYVKDCDSCQRIGQPNHRDEIPLNPQVVLEPFDRWALDFIGPINPPSNHKVYILVCTDYMTKWVEAKALHRAMEEAVIKFLFTDIFTRFGMPRELVIDGGPPFSFHGFKATLQKYHIQQRMNTPYHPQANGQVESTNKVIEAILTKTVKESRKDWSKRLLEALWAYRTTWRNTTGFSPYELVYGKSAVFPVEFEIKTLRTALAANLDLTNA
jgi:hypothetical protein